MLQFDKLEISSCHFHRLNSKARAKEKLELWPCEQFLQRFEISRAFFRGRKGIGQ